MKNYFWLFLNLCFCLSLFLFPSKIYAASLSPNVTLLSPNGSETWIRGLTYQVSWQQSTSSPQTDLFIYTRNNSNSFDTYVGAIAYNVSHNSGLNTYSWTIPSFGSVWTTPPDGKNIIAKKFLQNPQGIITPANKGIRPSTTKPVVFLLIPPPLPLLFTKILAAILLLAQDLLSKALALPTGYSLQITMLLLLPLTPQIQLPSPIRALVSTKLPGVSPPVLLSLSAPISTTPKPPVFTPEHTPYKNFVAQKLLMPALSATILLFTKPPR